MLSLRNYIIEYPHHDCKEVWTSVTREIVIIALKNILVRTFGIIFKEIFSFKSLKMYPLLSALGEEKLYYLKKTIL